MYISRESVVFFLHSLCIHIDLCKQYHLTEIIARYVDIQWCIPAFFAIYLAHFFLYKSLPFIMSLVVDEKSAIEMSSKINLMKLSRFSVDTIVMTIFSYLGFMVLEDFHGWDNLFADGTMAVERVYMPSASALLLCRLQVAYELKNLLDSCIFGDGVVFVVHHICTGILKMNYTLVCCFTG